MVLLAACGGTSSRDSTNYETGAEGASMALASFSLDPDCAEWGTCVEDEQVGVTVWLAYSGGGDEINAVQIEVFHDSSGNATETVAASRDVSVDPFMFSATWTPEDANGMCTQCGGSQLPLEFDIHLEASVTWLGTESEAFVLTRGGGNPDVYVMDSYCPCE
jgi:hypothetical protein